MYTFRFYSQDIEIKQFNENIISHIISYVVNNKYTTSDPIYLEYLLIDS